MSFFLDPFPYRGRCVGISISAGDAGIPPGHNAEHFVNQATYHVGTRYLLLGASLVLGHRWQEGGIMEHLARRAAEFPYSFPQPKDGGRVYPIINRLAWPDELPQYDDNLAGWITQIMDVREVQPAGITTTGLTDDSDLGKFARIRALTAMRKELVAASDVRICLGGAAGKPVRRLPGVLEEALLTYDAGKPLYLAGALGGITKALCDAILQRRMTDAARDAFHTPVEVAQLLQDLRGQHPYPDDEGPSRPGASYDALQHAERISLEQLASRAHLSIDDYLTLMTTPDMGRAIELATLGVARTFTPAQPVSPAS